MSESQLGFREGRGTRDAICQTRLLAERMISKNMKIFACFIDYKKAFDKVNHNKLIQVMRKHDVPSEEIRLMLNLLKFGEDQKTLEVLRFRKVSDKDAFCLQHFLTCKVKN